MADNYNNACFVCENISAENQKCQLSVALSVTETGTNVTYRWQVVFLTDVQCTLVLTNSRGPVKKGTFTYTVYILENRV